MSARQKAPGDLPPPTLVEDTEGLRRMLAEVEGARDLAVDTEGDSFYHYEEQVCLIQLSADGKDWLVDPLKGLDLDGFGRLLADPKRTKIFHDGEYDVRILKRAFGFRFAGLFDTRVAAAALGYEAPGLASVVEKWFGVELDKSQQRSNWSRRPLSPDQIAYARLDTHFLIPLRDRLRDQLEERGRTMIVEGECRRLEGLEPNERPFDPDEFLRLKGARGLDLRQMRVLRELFVMRDKLARERDVPPFKVLGNQILVDVARARARSPHALQKAGLSPKLVKRWGTPLVAAVKRAEAKGPLKRVPRLRPRDPAAGLDEASVELHERLKDWRKKQAKVHEMDASLVLNRHVLVRLAAERPTDEKSLRAADGMLDWQVELFGDELLELVATFERDLAAGRIELGRPRRRRRSDGD